MPTRETKREGFWTTPYWGERWAWSLGGLNGAVCRGSSALNKAFYTPPWPCGILRIGISINPMPRAICHLYLCCERQGLDSILVANDRWMVVNLWIRYSEAMDIASFHVPIDSIFDPILWNRQSVLVPGEVRKQLILSETTTLTTEVALLLIGPLISIIKLPEKATLLVYHNCRYIQSYIRILKLIFQLP